MAMNKTRWAVLLAAVLAVGREENVHAAIIGHNDAEVVEDPGQISAV